MNPAFAGTTYAPRISATYRNQWPIHADNTTAYATYAAAYEQFIPAFNSGFGVLVLADNDGNGLFKTTNFMASYAYRIAVNDEFNIRLGINAGFKQSNIDWDRLVFLDQLDPITGSVDPFGNPNITNELRPEDLTATVFDVGAGILAYNSKYYVCHCAFPSMQGQSLLLKKAISVPRHRLFRRISSLPNKETKAK
jgi:type IX secretion system PorP/SprF family membrane protein